MITKIQWCDYTFNPWRGCTKVSHGCKFCYAETLSNKNNKVLGIWGPLGERVVASEKYWKQPIKWNKEASELVEKRKVFCASLADVFEDNSTIPIQSRKKILQARSTLWKLIEITPNLNWLLLTKRSQNMESMLPINWLKNTPPNLWLGTSVEDQETTIRIEHLIKINSFIKFLSIEPMLEKIDLTKYLDKIDWVICGGESGDNARPFNIEWAEDLLEQCKKYNVPFFMKQLGSNAYDKYSDRKFHYRNSKKADIMEEWRPELRVREFPYEQ